MIIQVWYHSISEFIFTCVTSMVESRILCVIFHIPLWKRFKPATGSRASGFENHFYVVIYVCVCVCLRA